MLKVNGKPFSLASVPPAVQNLEKLLKKLPKDEVFTPSELIKKLGVPGHTLQRGLSVYPEHWRRWRGRTHWGSREAIKAFDKVTQ